VEEAMFTRDGILFIQKHIPTQYYTRKHKHGLWPLEVLQHQVLSVLCPPPLPSCASSAQIKEKFLGCEFWERIRKANLTSLNLSSSHALNFKEYLGTIASILRDAQEVKKRQLSDNNSIPSEHSGDTGSHSQMIEDDGIFTLKSSAPSGIHASSFLRRPLNRKPSFRLTDLGDDSLAGIDCPFVSESDVVQLRHRSPSPELGLSPGSGSHSRQQSPLSSKSGSFSFDMVDMGDGPVSNPATSGIANRASLPITPSNLLRSRPHKYPPRLSAGNLPPLSNHSSRSASPALLTPTSTATSNDIALDTPVAGEGAGGLSDIVLEATFLMKGLKILIIEDSTFQRKLMTNKLHKSGRRASGVSPEKKPSSDTGDSHSPQDVFNFSEVTLTTTPSPVSAAVTTAETPSAEIESMGESAPRSHSHTPQDSDHGGWHVSEAVNGEEAIRRLITTKETFDLIFVDENLQSSGGNLLGHEVSCPPPPLPLLPLLTFVSFRWSESFADITLCPRPPSSSAVAPQLNKMRCCS
jgi:CheY-like chemotaxis protein